MGPRRLQERIDATVARSMTGVAVALLAAVPAAVEAQDIVNGEALATRWCAGCHIVSRTASSGQANGLPSFPMLAASPQTTDASLRRAMTTTHSRMPDLSLSKQEQDNLIAYIFSLRPQ